jgi:hypothetical protein
VNIEGKDWLTEAEAAHYCGVSIRQFQAHYEVVGLLPRRFMGKKLYERAALYEAIAKAPAWDRDALPIRSPTDCPLGPYRNLTASRLRPYKPRKKGSADGLL